jgi:hypothetical protein
VGARGSEEAIRYRKRRDLGDVAQGADGAKDGSVCDEKVRAKLNAPT